LSFLPAITFPKIESSPSQWQDLTISDFSGGLCTAFPESNLKDNQFPALTNYYIEDDNSLKLRGPFRPYLVTSQDTVLSTAPLSFRWAEMGSTDYLVANYGTVVTVWDSTANRWAGMAAGTAIKTGLTSGYDVEFKKYSVNDAEDLIFCNGKDTPQRWLGANTSSASSDLGLAAPSITGTSAAHAAATVTGRGITINGTYYYKFTYFYDDSGTSTKYGESGPSGSVAHAITGASTASPQRVNLTSPPSATGTSYSKVMVYRSPADEIKGPYEYVGYYTGTGTSGTTELLFRDTCPNGEEGDEVPADAGTPPKLKSMLSFKGRLWGIGINASGALKNKGVWSNDGEPDMFSAANYAYFPDELAGPVAFKENVYWFTRKQIYVTTNGDPANAPIKICNKGCSSYRSIVDVGNGLVFQGDNNIYWVDFNTMAQDGDYPIPIGEVIKNKIADIPSAYKDNSVGELYKERYYLSYTGPNQTANTATLVWNVEVGTRLLAKGLSGGWNSLDWAANCIQEFEGGLWTADNTNKYVMEHDYAGADDYHTKTEYTAGTSHTLASELKTKIFHFDHEWSEKIISSLSLAVKTSGLTYDAMLGVDNSVSGANFTRGKTFTLGSASLAVDSTWLVWNQGTWDDFNWGSTTYGFQSSHKKFGSGAKGKNVQLSLISSDSQDTNLILLKLYYKTLPPPA